jgi:hypothetical protein
MHPPIEMGGIMAPPRPLFFIRIRGFENSPRLISSISKGVEHLPGVHPFLERWKSNAL